jgi:hypothetical protein
MKRNIKLTFLGIISVALFSTIIGCKFDESDSSTKVRIDISELKKKLVTPSQVSESNRNYNVSSPSSDAQTAVRTLLIAPLTTINHGGPYSPDEPFTSDVEEDLKKDAANSVDYINLVQLPTSKDYVEVEMPAISQGWQLFVAAASLQISSNEDLTDDDKVDSLSYVGFTRQSFTSADEFNGANVTLTMRRACLQDTIPKGCATFNDNKEAVASAAVEILAIEINGTAQTTHAIPFPWVVRSDATQDLANIPVSPSDVEARMNLVRSNFGTSIDLIKVITTHQLSVGQSSNCANLSLTDVTADFKTNCGTQEYSFIY